MSSLSLPIFGKIETCMCEWHPKYAAAAAILRKITFQFARQNAKQNAKSKIDRDFVSYIVAASVGIGGCSIDIVWPSLLSSTG